jgi:DNA polymerase-3 subunit gamma/tau
VFENIIAQDAAAQLCQDIASRRLAPSMLFFGPPASGKGSAALELARVLSCRGDASWNCSCPDCARHRYLLHGDLLILGPRSFSPEIAASRAAFLRDPSLKAAKILFIRSLRKLLSRFSPPLMEDDPRLGKLTPLLQNLEEGLEEFEAPGLAPAALEKTSESLAHNALKLESEGISDLIPIARIRRAAWWSRLAPKGKGKTLLIENADHMREEARNSLLKLLEEPPGTLTVVLTAARRESILPTILSRLRPYRFLKRESEKEQEVIRRIFREGDSGAASVGAYLDSFLPRPEETLRPLGAYFIASAARSAAMSLKHRGTGEIPRALSILGERYAPLAEAAGLGRSFSAKDVVKTLLAETGNFEGNSFPRFLRLVLDMISGCREALSHPGGLGCGGVWKKYVNLADQASRLNQNAALTLEFFFFRLKEELAESAAERV